VGVAGHYRSDNQDVLNVRRRSASGNFIYFWGRRAWLWPTCTTSH
jgi:hypothetical protein